MYFTISEKIDQKECLIKQRELKKIRKTTINQEHNLYEY